MSLLVQIPMSAQLSFAVSCIPGEKKPTQHKNHSFPSLISPLWEPSNKRLSPTQNDMVASGRPRLISSVSWAILKAGPRLPGPLTLTVWRGAQPGTFQ